MIREKGDDLTPSAAGVIVVPEIPDTPAAPGSLRVAKRETDSVEQLWGNVFFSPEHTAPKTIVVTAAESGEGTTQVSVALALVGSSSQHWLSVALVDFNFRRPKIAELFKVKPAPGIVDVVAGDLSVQSAMAHTDFKRLDILPAGQGTEPSMSSLRSERVKAVIQELAGLYDHVIIDAPPVNRYATAQALAGLTDGVLLVTKAGVTRREPVAEAKKRIELAQGKVLGVVLNQREFPIPGFLYDRM